MSFYIVVDGHLNKHDFEYLSQSSGRRLDPTVIPGSAPIKKELPVDGGTYAIEVMSKKVHSLDQENSVLEALEIFKKERIHHLPITSKGVLKGLVSDRDVLWLERFDLTEHGKVSQFMSRTILCCAEETPLEQVAKVMVNEKISALPIIGKDSNLVGIITHHDILRWIYDF